MNGKRAKAIRRAVYGEQSQREPRQYVRLSNGRAPGTIRNRPDSLRARYQAAKRMGVAHN